jgi:hypothetical protein
MKKSILFAITTTLALVTFANNQIPLSRLSALAARQKGAALKLLEAIVFINGSSNLKQHKEEIKRTVAFMDMSIDILIKKAPHEDIKTKTETLLNCWVQYKQLATDDQNIDIQNTIYNSDVICKAVDDVVAAYITYALYGSKNASPRTANIMKTMAQSCALRSKAKRISVFYALHRFQLLPNTNPVNMLINNAAEINSSLYNLIKAEVTTPDISNEITKLLETWEPFYNLVKETNGMNIADKKLDVVYVQNSMTTFFANIDSLVTAYSSLIKN